MSNMSIKLDILPLRDKLTTRVFGALVSKFNPGTNERVNASALESLGLTYEYLQDKIDRRPKNVLTPVLTTALEHIDYMAERYVMDNNCSFKTTEERFNKGIAMEDATEEAFEVEDGDITSGIIADMIDDLSKKHSTEIKDLAKYILKLEKEKQGDDRAMAEEEDEDYVQEDDTFEPDSEDDILIILSGMIRTLRMINQNLEKANKALTTMIQTHSETTLGITEIQAKLIILLTIQTPLEKTIAIIKKVAIKAEETHLMKMAQKSLVMMIPILLALILGIVILTLIILLKVLWLVLVKAVISLSYLDL